MRTMQTTGMVTSGHQLVVDLPPDIASGPHRVVVVLDEAVIPEFSVASWAELVVPGARWPAGGLSLRREDL